MNQVVKFPDMRPPNPLPPIPPIPTPAEYRRTAPVFTNSDASVSAQRHRRKRLWMWFGVAVALHAALLLTLWLTPPLRLKWNPSPDAWVQVTSIPKADPVQKQGPDERKATSDVQIDPSDRRRGAHRPAGQVGYPGSRDRSATPPSSD